MTLAPIVIWKNELILPIRASIKHSNYTKDYERRQQYFSKIIFLLQLVNTEQEEGRVCNFTPSLPINLSQIENQQELQKNNKSAKISNRKSTREDPPDLGRWWRMEMTFCVISFCKMMTMVMTFLCNSYFYFVHDAGDFLYKTLLFENNEGDDFLYNFPPLSTRSNWSFHSIDPIPSGAPHNYHLHHLTISIY